MRRARSVRRRACALLAVVVSAVSAAGCGSDTLPPERTIRVAVSTDAPEAFERLRITVSRGENAPTINNIYKRETIDKLPDSLLLKNATPLTDTGEPITTPISVRVAGLPAEDAPDANMPVIERSAQLTFVLDRPVLLRIPLCRDCIGSHCEDPSTTCLLGDCVKTYVDVATLPEDDGSQPLESVECPSASP